MNACFYGWSLIRCAGVRNLIIVGVHYDSEFSDLFEDKCYILMCHAFNYSVNVKVKVTL